MTESKAKWFIQGKLDCMKKCEYCYSQGNFGNQKEAFKMSINALEKQIPKKPVFYAHDYYCSVCNSIVGNNEFEWKRFKYCDTCGQKLDWDDEE